eukprot:968631-Prymnesium_polylepis.1
MVVGERLDLVDRPQQRDRALAARPFAEAVLLCGEAHGPPLVLHRVEPSADELCHRSALAREQQQLA